MKIEEAIRGVLTRPGYAGGLSIDDLRATDWTVVAQPAPVPTPTPTPTPVPAPAESAQGTLISRGVGSIVDSKGVTWTLGPDGAFYRDGVKMVGTGNIVLGLYWNRTTFQNATGYGWFFWNGTSWVGTADPRPVVPTPAPAASPIPSPTPAPSGALWGVNIAGGEFGSADRLGQDYVYPTRAQLDYWAAKGLKLIRVPFLARRISRPADWTALLDVITYASTRGLKVVLDLHEYGYISGAFIDGSVQGNAGAAAFVAFWKDMATRLAPYPHLIIGLMNEPHDQSVAQWWPAAAAAAAAVQVVDPTRTVLVPGTAWDGAHSWVSSGNAAAALALPKSDRIVFEMHQYLDGDSSGTHPTVVAGKGATILKAATDWARANGRRLFLGEYGFATDAASMKEGSDLIAFMRANADVWMGSAYWAAGAWWGGYMFSVEPASGVDDPQTALLVAAAK